MLRKETIQTVEFEIQVFSLNMKGTIRNPDLRIKHHYFVSVKFDCDWIKS
jgi:hypothetical protein